MKSVMLIGMFSVFSVSAIASDELITVAKASISYDMKDPESSKFRDIKINKTRGGADILCGQVNAKNSYGAYTGFTDFYYLNTDFKAIRPKDDSLINFNAIWNSNCKKK